MAVVSERGTHDGDKHRSSSPALPAASQDTSSPVLLGTASDVSLIRVVRLAALLWLSYVVVLAGIDRLFVATQPEVRPLPALYYLTQGAAALVVLGLAARAVQIRLGWAYLPAIVGLMAVTPIVLTLLLAPGLPPGPMTSAEGLGLRPLPILLLALVLVAYRYRWREVLIFSLATAILSLARSIFQAPPDAPRFDPGVIVTLIQTLSFTIVGACICLLMDRLRAQQASLADANARLRLYASTLDRLAASRERNRLARELHDTVAHTLSGLAVQLETVRAYWEIDPAAAQTMLDTALEVARGGLHETRQALTALRASPVDDLGLGLALRALAEQTAARAGLGLDLAVPERVPTLAPETEHAIYRIAQEALANVVSHAVARQLRVAVDSAADRLALTIEDDGRGFDPQADADRTLGARYGLVGLRERAGLIGAEIEIASAPGAGTTVRLTVCVD